ncbi:MAG: HPP family protein [Phycisphaerae bacterium]|nr:HPP family protein [Phycisphaerae bacterium]
MARSLTNMLDEFRHYWKHYVLQSLLATGSVFLILVILGLQEAVIIASLGATTFVVFALPEKFTAQARNVIGGHTVGLLCGFAGSALLHLFPSPESMITQSAMYAFSVGLAIFVMVVFDTEHPPAAGTALGVAMEGFTLHIAGSVLFFAVILSVIRWMLKKYLRDLA